MSIGPLEAALIASAMVPLIVFLIVLAKLLAAPVDPGRVSEFLIGAGLPAEDPHARDVVTAFLVRARRQRAAGTVLGALAGGVVAGPTGMVAGAMAGFLVGALYGATAAPTAGTGGRRVAALAPRALADYVPRGHLLAVRALALTAGVLALAGAVLPRHDAGVVSGGPLMWLAVAGAALLVVAVTEAAARHVVGRRQQAPSPLDVTLDDAVRSACARAVVGAGLGLALVVCAVASWLTGVATDVQLLRWTLPLVGFASCAAAPVAWAVVARAGTWQVRRVTGAAESP